MKTAALTLLSCLIFAGCSGSGTHAKTCEVFSPASVNVSTTQNDQRVEAHVTGEPSGKPNEQNCP